MLEGEALAAWLRDRAGKFTASRLPDALDIRKDGKPGAKRIQLQFDILAERSTGESVRHYVNPAMEWGLVTEPEARAAWEAHTGEIVTECGFYDHPRIDMFGATPDGLLSPDGLIEIKCPTTPTFVRWRMAGVVPEEHKPQMLGQMACTGRKWCEFVAYDPRIRDERARLFVRRYTPTPEEIAGIEKVAEEFLAEIDRMWEVFTTGSP